MPAPSSALSRPAVVGLTGGIAAGKSLVGRMFEALGMPVWNADEAAKMLYANDESLRRELVARWGDHIGVHDHEGSLVDIHRRKLAQIIFNDSHELAWLERRVHPAVGRAFEMWASEVQRTAPANVVIREAAILFESQSHLTCDAVVTVEAPLDLRITRALSREGNGNSSKADILKRVQRQWESAGRIARADFVINNDETSQLLPQVLDLAKAIRTRFS